MPSNLNIPMQRVWVDLKYLTQSESHNNLFGYWYGVSLIPNRVIGCHITLADGANWCRVPLHALRCEDLYPTQCSAVEIQRYDCFGYDGEITRYDWLRGQPVNLIDAKDLVGHYLFTIDYDDRSGSSPYAEDPEQHKQHHIFACEDGTIRARPNNFLRWVDGSLYEPFEDIPPYKRMTEIFSCE